MDTKPEIALPSAQSLFDRIIQFSIRNAIWVMLFTHHPNGIANRKLNDTVK